MYYTAQYCTYFSIYLYCIVLYGYVYSTVLTASESSQQLHPYGLSLLDDPERCVYCTCISIVLYCTVRTSLLYLYLLYVHLYCSVCTCPGWRFTECKLPWWSSMLIGHGSLSLSYLWAICTIEEITCVAIWSIELYRENEKENKMENEMENERQWETIIEERRKKEWWSDLFSRNFFKNI